MLTRTDVRTAIIATAVFLSAFVFAAVSLAGDDSWSYLLGMIVALPAFFVMVDLWGQVDKNVQRERYEAMKSGRHPAGRR